LPFNRVIAQPANRFDTPRKRDAVKLTDRQADEDFEPLFERAECLAEGKHSLGFGAIDRRGIGNAPPDSNGRRNTLKEELR
jgi:hypothetical protein